jgi:hypothetical protein
MWGSHSGTAEDSCLLSCDAVSSGWVIWDILELQNGFVFEGQGVRNDCLTLKMKAHRSFESSETPRRQTQSHRTRPWSPSQNKLLTHQHRYTGINFVTTKSEVLLNVPSAQRISAQNQLYVSGQTVAAACMHFCYNFMNTCCSTAVTRHENLSTVRSLTV